ncbi:formate dehydrogenase subunit delta [Parathalassolituus penaei]|uniref:Formate dehydrogenase subunit delta n=1 Tax=Parathalassolituus penaei TaxID=2997323 RepID=A0A9X3IS62_9GAMM|nr:formate dehydrogenase subunit delta [Parathalassolituus penaei]MCY0964554.1 formate dehydrogenase subunit delta [Parathalassolituus penaei]
MSDKQHESEQDHLVRMINQIAHNNSAAGDHEAIADVVAGHVKKFWPRRMKGHLAECLDNGGDVLHPAARLAGERLRDDGHLQDVQPHERG